MGKSVRITREGGTSRTRERQGHNDEDSKHRQQTGAQAKLNNKQPRKTTPFQAMKYKETQMATQIQMEFLIHNSHKRRHKLLEPEFPNLPRGLIENIVTYVNSLPEFGKDTIDRPVFMAQMWKHFGLTDKFMIERIFSVFSLNGPSCCVSFISYCRLICIFLSDNIAHKINYAFDIYNITNDGLLKKSELKYMLFKSCDVVGDPDDDRDENLDYLLNLLLRMIDGRGNADGEIDRHEFASIVQYNSLMMECVGPCLPSAKHVAAFMSIVSADRTKFEVMGTFRHERRHSLRGAAGAHRGAQKFYPVSLQCHKD